MRWALGTLVLAATACEGPGQLRSPCPGGERCSPVTGGALVVHGTPIAGQPAQLYPTLVGGTQELALEFADQPFTGPYDVDDGGGTIIALDHASGATVTVRGVATGDGELRILDPDTAELFGRADVTARRLGAIELVPPATEQLDAAAPPVWLAGPQTVVIALEVGAARLVDTSLQVTADGGARTAWDTLAYADLAPGHHEVTVTAGGGEPAALALDAVASADAIEPSPPITLTAAMPSTMCFYARSAGRTVTGATWTFTSDNGVVEPSRAANCPLITPATAGPLHLTASAAGAAYTATFDVRATP